MRNAEIAQLVEHQLPKLRAAGSNPVFRSLENQIVTTVDCLIFFILKWLVYCGLTGLVKLRVKPKLL